MINGSDMIKMLIYRCRNLLWSPVLGMVDHALKATNPRSPILAEMNNQLVEKAGIRILGSFYRVTYQLTTNSPVYGVDELRGKKIRGVPFPIWMSMIRGMEAIPTPVGLVSLRLHNTLDSYPLLATLILFTLFPSLRLLLPDLLE